MEAQVSSWFRARPSIAILAAIAVGILGIFLPAGAQAGKYKFKDCGDPGPSAIFAKSPANAQFDVWEDCGGAWGYRIRPKVGKTFNNGDIASVKYVLPSGIAFTSLDLMFDYIESRDGLKGVIEFNSAAYNAPLTIATTTMPGSHMQGPYGVTYDLGAQRRQVFRAYMRCNWATCKEASPIQGTGMALGTLFFTIEDSIAPQVANISGNIYTGGTISGQATLGYAASDLGGGLHAVRTYVNGTLAKTQNGECTTNQTRTVPCKQFLLGEYVGDTTAGFWREGLNSVQVCAWDYAEIGSAHSACTPKIDVMVDNS